MSEPVKDLLVNTIALILTYLALGLFLLSLSNIRDELKKRCGLQKIAFFVVAWFVIIPIAIREIFVRVK